MDFLYIIKIFICIFYGLFLGLLSAIPVGAVQIEVAKKAINGHYTPAIAIACGSATSDLIYGSLTLFGLSYLLLNREFQIVTYILGIIVISFLLFRSYREHQQGFIDQKTHMIRKKRISFLTGFTIAITNPGIILWWIIGFKLFIDLNLFLTITPFIKVIFILSGCFGLGGYLIFLASILHNMQKSVSDKFIRRMNLISMVLLSLLVGYFNFKVITIIFNLNFYLP